MADKLTVFIERLAKIGIKIEVIGNAPWLYLRSINGKMVTEKYLANHGFTLAFYGGKNVKFTDLKEIFNLIRKYK